MLPVDFPDARVFTFKHRSLESSLCRYSQVLEIAGGLLRNVLAVRSECQYRPIVWVAHSLGGLIVKAVRFISLYIMMQY